MGGWNPWRALRGREHIDFRLAPLPHDLRAVYWPRGERVAIVISPNLDQAERKAALAHELVHDERGGGCACPPGAHGGLRQLAAKEERTVRTEVARRLVPADDLAAFVDRLTSIGEGVTVADVAEHFEVPHDVAARAVAIRMEGPLGR